MKQLTLPFLIVILFVTNINAQVINTYKAISYPEYIAFDSLGNLFVYSYGNYFIDNNGLMNKRYNKINIKTGVTTTVIAPNVNNYDYTAVDKQGNLYVSKGYDANVLEKIDTFGNVTTVPCNKIFIGGIAVDGKNNIFISSGNYIFKIDTSGTITTFAGNGKSVYPGGNGDGGPAISASLGYYITDMVMDRIGNMYLAIDDFAIKKIDTLGIITTVGNNNGVGVRVSNPHNLAIDNQNNLYVVPINTNTETSLYIQRINATGKLDTIAGNGSATYSGDGGPATLAGMNPYKIAIDKDGNIFVADNANSRIREIIGGALPITISSFTATANNQTIVTNWQSATELNTSHFKIQHSTTGTSFTDIGTVKAIGSGANSYSFNDDKPTNGINYYRLQSVDKDGSSSYSKVVSVTFGNKESFPIVPNPARDFATISFSKTVDKATIEVYDFTGKAVITQSFNGGANSYKLNTQTLSNGVYVIKVNTATGSYNEKLLISK